MVWRRIALIEVSRQGARASTHHHVGAAAIAAAVLAAGCAGPSGQDGAALSPPSSRSDAAVGFYDWRAPPPTAPGKLLRQERLDAEASLADAGEQFRILYSATDGVAGRGIVVVSGAVFLPRTPPPASGWPVIAWAHGTAGVGDACAPSRNPRSERDKAYLNTWLREGYAVVASDYQGLGTSGPHPYLHTRAQAYSVLDGVRAALTMPGVANQVVLVGQSQGGGAAFGTAGIAPSYAPDIHLLGTVATGTPYLGLQASQARSDQELDRVAPQIAYSMYVAVTAKLVQPSFDAASIFRPEAMPAFGASAEECVRPMFRRLTQEGRSERNTVYPGAGDRLWSIVGPATAYVTLQLRQPVFMGIGGKDIDVPAAGQQRLAIDACKAGTRVVAKLYPDEDHSSAVNASLRDSLPFVRSLMNGRSVTPTCGS